MSVRSWSFFNTFYEDNLNTIQLKRIQRLVSLFEDMNTDSASELNSEQRLFLLKILAQKMAKISQHL